MAKQDFSVIPGNFVYCIWFLTIEPESAGWTLVNFHRFLKMSKIQDGRQRPF